MVVISISGAVHSHSGSCVFYSSKWGWQQYFGTHEGSFTIHHSGMICNSMSQSRFFACIDLLYGVVFPLQCTPPSSLVVFPHLSPQILPLLSKLLAPGALLKGSCWERSLGNDKMQYNHGLRTFYLYNSLDHVNNSTCYLTQVICSISGTNWFHSDK